MIKKITFAIIIIFSPALLVFPQGQSEENVKLLQEGIDYYNNGNLKKASTAFSAAAGALDNKIASMGYYNKGVVQAELAQNTEDVEQKRQLLKSSYQSLKRSVQIGLLPSKQEEKARQNMEIVREQITKLPPQQENNQQQTDRKEDGKEKPQNKQSAQKNNFSKEDMLKKQQDLSEKTSTGQRNLDELAKEQKDLQEQSKQAGMSDAADNQERAAEALKRGDRKKASKYQEAAEQAIVDSMQNDNSNQDDQSKNKNNAEAEEILKEEVDRESMQNRLDKVGGIIDADKDW